MFNNFLECNILASDTVTSPTHQIATQHFEGFVNFTLLPEESAQQVVAFAPEALPHNDLANDTHRLQLNFYFLVPEHPDDLRDVSFKLLLNENVTEADLQPYLSAMNTTIKYGYQFSSLYLLPESDLVNATAEIGVYHEMGVRITYPLQEKNGSFDEFGHREVREGAAERGDEATALKIFVENQNETNTRHISLAYTWRLIPPPTDLFGDQSSVENTFIGNYFVPISIVVVLFAKRRYSFS